MDGPQQRIQLNDVKCWETREVKHKVYIMQTHHTFHGEKDLLMCAWNETALCMPPFLYSHFNVMPTQPPSLTKREEKIVHLIKHIFVWVYKCACVRRICCRRFKNFKYNITLIKKTLQRTLNVNSFCCCISKPLRSA